MQIILIHHNLFKLQKLKNYVAECYPEHEIAAFLNPVKALNYIKENPQEIDICFTAVIMPKMTGFRMADEICKIQKRIKVVFVSRTDEYAIDAWRHQVRDYLVEPITCEGVKHTVNNCLGQQAEAL